MKKLILFLLPILLFAQTPKEGLQRAIGTNTVTGSNLGAPFQVATIAALKAVTVANVTNGQQVSVVCYATANDGGGGEFYYSSGSAVADNGGTVIAPTSGSGRWLRLYDGAVNVKWFGAGGQAATDDTAEIQAAIDFVAGLSKKGSVYLPAGEYVVSTTLTMGTSGVTLYGDSMWKTLIRRSTDHGDTFFITGNDGTGVVLTDIVVRDIGIRNEGLMTSGAHIHLNGVFHADVRNIMLKDGFEGISCQALTGSAIDNINVVFDNNYTGTDTNRMYMRFTMGAVAYAHPMCGDVFVSNFNLRNGSSTGLTQYGIFINSADGIWFSNGHVGGASGTNLTLVNAGYQLTLVFFDNVMFDAGTATSNVLFQGSHASNVGSGIQFSNCYLAGGDGINNGVNFGSGTDFYGVLFSNTTITGHKQNGVLVNSTDLYNITFDNCVVRGNSRNPTSTYDGYRFEPDCGRVSITGGNSGGPEGIGGPDTQAYGIRIAAGTGNNIRVVGVDTSGNLAGTIANGATGIANVFLNSSGQFNVRDFGALGNGSTDDTAAIQAAIDAAEASWGGAVYLPQGQYKVTSTLTIREPRVSIIGDGTSTSVLMRATDYGDTIDIAPTAPATSIQNITLQNFRIYSSTGITTGSHIEATLMQHSNFLNLQIDQGYRGIHLVSCIASNFTDLDLNTEDFFAAFQSGSCLIQLSRQSGETNCSELFFTNINARGNVDGSASELDTALYVTSADGVWFSNCHFGFNRNASCTVDRINNDDQVSGLHFSNTWFDGGGTYGLRYVANGGASGFLGYSSFANCNFIGHSIDAIRIDEIDCQELAFSSCMIGRAGLQGFHAVAGSKFTFSSCHFFDNNADNATAAGAWLEGTTSDVTFASCQFYNDAASGHQDYGIYCEDTVDRVIASSCVYRNNDTLAVDSTTSGTELSFVNSFTDDTNTYAADGANLLTLPALGDWFQINGANNVSTIAAAASFKGRKITLVFTVSITVNDGSNLKLAGNYTTSADDTLTLNCDGTNWIETGRSAN